MTTLNTVIDGARERASQLPIPGMKHKSPRRVTARRAGIGGAGLVGLGALAYFGHMLYSNRFVTSKSTVNTVTPLDDGRLIVSLVDGVAFVVNGLEASTTKAIAIPGETINYRVTRWHLGGVPHGQVLRG